MNTITEMITEAEETRRGLLLVEMLGLRAVKDQHRKPFNPPRYSTAWGTKTALGLYRSVERIVQDGE